MVISICVICRFKLVLFLLVICVFFVIGILLIWWWMYRFIGVISRLKVNGRCQFQVEICLGVSYWFSRKLVSVVIRVVVFWLENCQLVMKVWCLELVLVSKVVVELNLLLVDNVSRICVIRMLMGVVMLIVLQVGIMVQIRVLVIVIDSEISSVGLWLILLLYQFSRIVFSGWNRYDSLKVVNVINSEIVLLLVGKNSLEMVIVKKLQVMKLNYFSVLLMEEVMINCCVCVVDIGVGVVFVVEEIFGVVEGDVVFMVVFLLEDGLCWFVFLKMKKGLIQVIVGCVCCWCICCFCWLIFYNRFVISCRFLCVIGVSRCLFGVCCEQEGQECGIQSVGKFSVFEKQ